MFVKPYPVIARTHSWFLPKFHQQSHPYSMLLHSRQVLHFRQDHKLVTSGHPSYAGGLCVFLGILLCHFQTRSWLVSCSGVIGPGGQVDFGMHLGGFA
ncbi:hypothetical protein BDR07DRAFT_40267 [Suillus spraguei]|nr:hypothetical protein BDR07DRAFT_40267 [Suillus spraguei]